jgi:hypothetical protein
MIKHESPLASIRWLNARNYSGLTVPAFGIVMIQQIDDDGYFQIIRPTIDSSKQFAIVGPSPIAVGSTGAISMDWPLPVAYNNGVGGSVSYGERWGTKGGSFLIHPNQTGLLLLSGPDIVRLVVVAEKEVCRFD